MDLPVNAQAVLLLGLRCVVGTTAGEKKSTIRMRRGECGVRGNQNSWGNLDLLEHNVPLNFLPTRLSRFYLDPS